MAAVPPASPPPVPPAESAGAWGAALLWAAVGACALAGLSLLVRKWQGVDPAVFEADTYVQGLRAGWAHGRLWPWELTGRFWPFLLMAPGIYLHAGLGLLPTALPALILQGLAVVLAGVLAGRLAQARGAPPAAGAGLALVWMLHPAAGVGMAWGWSPYATGAPLLVGAALALARGRGRWALGLALAAAAMKINVAMMVGGLALAGAAGLLGRVHRATGRRLALGMVAWGLGVGLAFTSALWCVGTLRQDLHLGGPAPATAGGLATVALMLLPLLPLLGRREALVALLGAGAELAYTGLVNPANSGLIPAAALVLAAAGWGLGARRHLGLRLLLAGGLALGAHQRYAPPRVWPLPLSPAGLAYRPDPAGARLRAWVAALPPDAWLVAFDPANGAVGTHPGPVIEPAAWDGHSRAAVLLPQGIADDRGLGGCSAPLVPAREGRPGIVAGWCGEGPPAAWAPARPALECLDGLELDRP